MKHKHKHTLHSNSFTQSIIHYIRALLFLFSIVIFLILCHNTSQNINLTHINLCVHIRMHMCLLKIYKNGHTHTHTHTLNHTHSITHAHRSFPSFNHEKVCWIITSGRGVGRLVCVCVCICLCAHTRMPVWMSMFLCVCVYVSVSVSI